MMGMGFLRLNTVLEKHKWTPGRGHDEIESSRRKEDLFLWIVVTVFLGVILAAVLFSGR